MMVESHWSQKKRLYILPYNRPRCDFVVYALYVKVIAKFIADYEMLSLGSKKPSWWLHFVNEWRNSSSRALVNVYATNDNMWTYQCDAFLSSRFMICKHLTKEMRGQSIARWCADEHRLCCK